MRTCPISGSTTNCTEKCRDCAKEMHRDLKEMVGKAELVTEELIRRNLGNEAFELLREHGFIEHCRLDENGIHWYAI